MMSRICMEAETSPFFDHAPPYVTPATSVAEATARGACNAAREIGAKYIVAFTETGSSAMTVSLARPNVPIIAYTANAKTRSRVSLFWGVVPRELPAMQRDADQLVNWCTADLLSGGFGLPGERVVIVFGAPIGVSGSTNSIRIHVLK
jgi:pyruvate kinase